MKSSTFPI